MVNLVLPAIPGHGEAPLSAAPFGSPSEHPRLQPAFEWRLVPLQEPRSAYRDPVAPCPGPPALSRSSPRARRAASPAPLPLCGAGITLLLLALEVCGGLA